MRARSDKREGPPGVLIAWAVAAWAVAACALVFSAAGCGALLDVDFDRVVVPSALGDGGVGGTGGGDGGDGGTAPGPSSSPSGICAGNSVGCGKDGATPRACQDGQWLEQARCEGATPVCVKGTCKASCASGDVDCAGNTPRACENGNLIAKAACSGELPVCADGACVACAEGVTACSGATVTRCQGGTYVDDHACSGAKPDCSKGACVGCTMAGACVDDRSKESCGSDGSYATTVACADPKSYCSGLACVACPPGHYNCNDGHDACESTLDTTSGCAACQVPDRTCYEDKDGDNFGNPAVARQVCGACPVGWTSDHTDCLDTDVDVHPGQVYIVPSPPRDLDFNCDTVKNRRLRSGGTILTFPAKVFIGCPGVGVGCSDSWNISGDLPACGRTMTRCIAPQNGSDCLDDPSSPVYSVECQ